MALGELDEGVEEVDAVALGRIQVLVYDAIASDAQRLDETVLAEQVSALRSAALIGMQETSARTGKLMRKHHALAKRLIEPRRLSTLHRRLADPRRQQQLGTRH